MASCTDNSKEILPNGNEAVVPPIEIGMSVVINELKMARNENGASNDEVGVSNMTTTADVVMEETAQCETFLPNNPSQTFINQPQDIAA